MDLSDTKEGEEGEGEGEEWGPVEPMEGLEGGVASEGGNPEDKYSELDQPSDSPTNLR